MTWDLATLSRAQFALTIMFHYLFPPLTLGMGGVLVYLEARYLRTRDPVYEEAARFWTSLFAVNFALGVATGIVMEFQFGTNWASYSRFVGDVFGSVLAAEGIFAFFLESGFLAVLVFGWERVSAGFHLFATAMVWLGSLFSAIWIVVANSWQQTPAGHRVVPMLRDGAPWLVDGRPVLRAEVADFWEVVLNPSTVQRLSHTLIGAFILGAFFIMSISAYYLLKRRHEDFARRSFSGALAFAAVFSLAQLFSGHLNARMVSREQPAKLAAFEGHFVSGPADLNLLGWPDGEAARVRFPLALPGGVSFLARDRFDAPLPGLDRFARRDWPPLGISFASYHLMVALGLFFIALTLGASVLRWRGTLFQRRWLLWVFVFAVALPFAANELGWVAAEVGRQPFSVYPRLARGPDGELALGPDGHVQYSEAETLRTADAVSPGLPASHVAGSLAMFALLYLLLLAVWLFLLDHKIRVGPKPVHPPPRTRLGGLREAEAGRTLHEGSLTEAKG